MEKKRGAPSPNAVTSPRARTSSFRQALNPPSSTFVSVKAVPLIRKNILKEGFFS
jgi:hypothetical protein